MWRCCPALGRAGDAGETVALTFLFRWRKLASCLVFRGAEVGVRYSRWRPMW